MSHIRNDFFGVVHVHTPQGSVALRAGDEVPKGAKVDPELVATRARSTRTTNKTELKNDKTSVSDA